MGIIKILGFLLAVTLVLLYLLPKTPAEDDIKHKMSHQMKKVLGILCGFAGLLIVLASWFFVSDIT